MTPLAREELRRYCQDAAKARKAKEPWTFADWTDYFVALVCALGFVFLCGVWTGESRAEARAKSCLAHLPDGRALMTEWMGKDGVERCTYQAPRVDKRTGKVWRQG